MQVPAAELESALALLLEAFPDGLEEERVGDVVELAGYLPAGVAPGSAAGWS